MYKKNYTLPLFFFLYTQILAQDPSTAYTMVDQMPYFPGCEVYAVGSEEKRNCSNQAVVEYIAKTLTYPERAKLEGAEGIVYISFVINPAGKVIRPKILKDIGGGCGQEAIKVVRSMPHWEPGQLRGQPVPVQLKVPIHFQFTNPDPTSNYTFRWGELNDYQVTRKNIRKNLSEPVWIFDEAGERVDLTNLTFSINKNNKVHTAQSNGTISPQMHKMAKKLKKGSLFSIIATIQKKGQFIEIDKEFVIVN